MNRNLCTQMKGGINKVTIPSHKRSFFLLPILGMVFFASLSFVHDGFRTNRDIQSYYIPLIIGLAAGLIISYYRNRIETDARSFERQLSKEREDAALGRAAAPLPLMCTWTSALPLSRQPCAKLVVLGWHGDCFSVAANQGGITPINKLLAVASRRKPTAGLRGAAQARKLSSRVRQSKGLIPRLRKGK